MNMTIADRRDAVFLSAMGLLVGLGIILHAWGKTERGIIRWAELADKQ